MSNNALYVMQASQTLQNEAQLHKGGTTPWVMWHRVGDLTVFMVMCGDQIILKAQDGVEAVLCLLALYYATCLPYPSRLNGVEVLMDDVHEKDKSSKRNLKTSLI